MRTSFLSFPLIAAATLLAAIVPLSAAEAYIGPGMGLGMLGAGLGVLMTSASAIFYLFALSVRRAFRRLMGLFIRNSTPESDTAQAEPLSD